MEYACSPTVSQTGRSSAGTNHADDVPKGRVSPPYDRVDKPYVLERVIDFAQPLYTRRRNDVCYTPLQGQKSDKSGISGRIVPSGKRFAGVGYIPYLHPTIH
jgi:hypothetical protein